MMKYILLISALFALSRTPCTAQLSDSICNPLPEQQRLLEGFLKGIEYKKEIVHLQGIHANDSLVHINDSQVINNQKASIAGLSTVLNDQTIGYNACIVSDNKKTGKIRWKNRVIYVAIGMDALLTTILIMGK